MQTWASLTLRFERKTDVWFNRKNLGRPNGGNFSSKLTERNSRSRWGSTRSMTCSRRLMLKGWGELACPWNLRFWISDCFHQEYCWCYIFVFFAACVKIGGNCTNPNVNVWFWHQKQTWRSHFFRPTPWPILNTFWNYPPPSNSHILPFLVGNPELNLHLWLASWDRPKICLCACVFPWDLWKRRL